MGTWDQLASLPLEIDRYELEGRELAFSEEFVRYTTLITLRGGGEEGVGEDVVYDGLDHTAFQAAGPTLPLAGTWTLGSFGDDTPETSERMLRVLERYPGTRFKLDPTNTWSDALIEELAQSGAVDSLDLKGQYKGTPVDVTTDPELYAKLVEAFPDAWLEDPDINDETRPVLEPYRDRVTWDAPIHSVDDILALEWEPRMVNIKPSRVGSLEELGRAYDFCAERGIGAYGGGQTELGVGRDHIQYLAALFHPDTPNDVAPGGFNSPALPDGLPSSPIHLKPAATGFRFA